MKLHTFKIGGVHPAEHKITADVATVQAPLPTEAIFPLSQHIARVSSDIRQIVLYRLW